jgi:hypothetical protein
VEPAVERPALEEIGEERDDLLVPLGGHLDLHELTIDELALVLVVERDEVGPRVPLRAPRAYRRGHAIVIRDRRSAVTRPASPSKMNFSIEIA